MHPADQGSSLHIVVVNRGEQRLDVAMSAAQAGLLELLAYDQDAGRGYGRNWPTKRHHRRILQFV